MKLKHIIGYILFIVSVSCLLYLASPLQQPTPDDDFGGPVLPDQSNPSAQQAQLDTFAELDENGVVLRVIVVTQEVIDSGRFGDPLNWAQTSTDKKHGKNYAGIGYKYDKKIKDFIPKKPDNAIEYSTYTGEWILPTTTAPST